MQVHQEIPESDPEMPWEIESLALGRFLRTLRRFMPVILLSMVSIMLLYTVIAVAVYLHSPDREVTTLPFRLNFEGANRGRYPNGLKFSPAEITADPILEGVYKANGLSQFLSLTDFSRSVVVLESNRAVETLIMEYQAKLADQRLTPVDREQLEKEFDQKRASIGKGEYAISFLQERGGIHLPPTLAKKVLSDILSAWARYAAVDKSALLYQVQVLSPKIFDPSVISNSEPVIALLMFRTKLIDAMETVDKIQNSIPGAVLIRAGKDQTSLTDITERLEDILRFQIEPLIVAATSGSLTHDPEVATQFLRAQISYDEQQLNTARLRAVALQQALAAYERQRVSIATSSPRPLGSPGSPDQQQPRSGDVVPQLSDSFLDRLVSLATQNADLTYRQQLVDDIKQAVIAVVPLETKVAYDKALLAPSSMRKSGQRIPDAEVHRRLLASLQIANEALEQAHRIYETASRQLNPVTELYSPTGPATVRIERAVTVTRMLWWGIFVFVAALPLVIGGCILYERARREEAIDELLHRKAPGLSAHPAADASR